MISATNFTSGKLLRTPTWRKTHSRPKVPLYSIEIQFNALA